MVFTVRPASDGRSRLTLTLKVLSSGSNSSSASPFRYLRPVRIAAACIFKEVTEEQETAPCSDIGLQHHGESAIPGAAFTPLECFHGNATLHVSTRHLANVELFFF